VKKSPPQKNIGKEPAVSKPVPPEDTNPYKRSRTDGTLPFSSMVTVRMTRDEKKLLDAAVRESRVSLNKFCVTTLLARAHDILNL